MSSEEELPNDASLSYFYISPNSSQIHKTWFDHIDPPLTLPDLSPSLFTNLCVLFSSIKSNTLGCVAYCWSIVDLSEVTF